MDLDAYVSAHHAEWTRLGQLIKQRHLTGAESDELLELYQRVGTHLSVIRTSAPDPSVVQYLSTLLARARTRALGARTSSWADFARFFAVSLPVTLYRLRWWWLSIMAISYAAAAVIAIWIIRDPAVSSQIATPEAIKQLVDHDFADYYSEYAARDFAFRVWTNNVWVAAASIGGGILGFPVVIMLWQNTVNLGVMAGLMISHGKADVFFGLILPHGLLELTAVFVAAGAGLRIFWSWVAPGALSRSASLGRTARSMMVVVLGLVIVLGVSGVIEAFVTPSGLPTWARIAIGAIAEVAFLIYVFTMGRRADRLGESADLAAEDLSAEAPVAG
ncbi:stage II sporulation protein M [Branchiibius cervicis]|uniref:Stage II sporulation protein M n=1 Tax=Branchiibius cervicis TaxID=908252 RepID=A0ABW2AWF2_9MICO